jgi:hypothetical protein
VIGLVAGWIGAILLLAAPRSVAALAAALVLLGVAFAGAFIRSGIAFGPGLVMVIVASVRSGGTTEPVEFSTTPSGGFLGLDDMWHLEHREVRVPPALAKKWDRLIVLPESERVVVLPESERMVTLPEAEPQSNGATERSVSRDGRIQAGPPGVIGILGPS